jgi:hypothetical protein|tara:strand:- start:45 stop:146 length:102 start_codon:yes stop_codon:yes gene_type:complete
MFNILMQRGVGQIEDAYQEAEAVGEHLDTIALK